MILGIGSDLIDIRRIEKAFEKHGKRFKDRVFTPLEQKKAESRRLTIETYAKRFAAKEACSKALGTGIRQGTFFRDMGVINLPGGKPSMELTGGAKANLEKMTPEGYRAVIHLSITDEYPLAQAYVIIEAIKD